MRLYIINTFLMSLNEQIRYYKLERFRERLHSRKNSGANKAGGCIQTTVNSILEIGSETVIPPSPYEQFSIAIEQNKPIIDFQRRAKQRRAAAERLSKPFTRPSLSPEKEFLMRVSSFKVGIGSSDR